MLSGCVATQGPSSRQLPAEPAFARPVTVADPAAGESAIVVAARERAGRQKANAIITNMVEWYRGVRQSYAAPEP